MAGLEYIDTPKEFIADSRATLQAYKKDKAHTRR